MVFDYTDMRDCLEPGPTQLRHATDTGQDGATMKSSLDQSRPEKRLDAILEQDGWRTGQGQNSHGLNPGQVLLPPMSL